MIARLRKKIGPQRLVGELDDRGVWRSRDAVWQQQLRRFGKKDDWHGPEYPAPIVGRVLTAARELGATVEWGDKMLTTRATEPTDGRVY